MSEDFCRAFSNEFSTLSGKSDDLTITIKVEIDDSDVSEDELKSSCDLVIPEKSKARYEKTYEIFKDWLQEKKATISEKTMLSYFLERSNTLKSPGSLWAQYSMLKSTIRINNGIDISHFPKLIAFLKKKNIGHNIKKSKVFTREQVNKFLREAPDKTYLMMKVAMIMGISGACRRVELTNLTIDNIEDQGSVVIVNIPDTKTNALRTFTITDKPNQGVNFLKIFRKYVEMRPKHIHSRRFFYALREGKCINQLVGINTMGRVPQKIAEFLNLEEPNCYTGHAFRRTSTTLLTIVNSGIDVLAPKRPG